MPGECNYVVVIVKSHIGYYIVMKDVRGKLVYVLVVYVFTKVRINIHVYSNIMYNDQQLFVLHTIGCKICSFLSANCPRVRSPTTNTPLRGLHRTAGAHFSAESTTQKSINLFTS